MTLETELLQEWKALADRAGLHPAAALGERLIAGYAEPQRVYHDVRHLAQVTRELRRLGASASLQLAGWFHDAVYQPGQGDNEARSAELARTELAACGYAEADRVAAAVAATLSHRNAPVQFALLMDADLAILGAAPAEYADYAAAIRREYASVPDATYRQGRAAFLRGQLALQRIFRTQEFHDRCDVAARRNLLAELTRMEAAPCN